MKMKIKGCRPVKIDGKWDLVDYEEEREYPDELAGRHSELCIYCGFPSYPECREWCEDERFKSKKS